MDEIRNELLYIDTLINKTDEKEKICYTGLLLERFYYDITNQLKDLEYKKEKLLNNMELLKKIIQDNPNIQDRTLKKIIEKN